ncbi:hypothetical protein [Elstera sp.]|uniref:hypothetical protein n=1 Tax=Elstera sp. TaxID=1916664 RepID=UPI0037BFAFB2
MMLETQNAAWGFFGTMGRANADSVQAWALAFAALTAATGATAEEIRAFLDSGHGRHFADDVCAALTEAKTLPEAIASTVRLWQTRRISTETARVYRLPYKSQYLQAFMKAATEEMLAAA